MEGLDALYEEAKDYDRFQACCLAVIRSGVLKTEPEDNLEEEQSYREGGKTTGDETSAVEGVIRVDAAIDVLNSTDEKNSSQDSIVNDLTNCVGTSASCGSSSWQKECTRDDSSLGKNETSSKATTTTTEKLRKKSVLLKCKFKKPKHQHQAPLFAKENEIHKVKKRPSTSSRKKPSTRVFNSSSSDEERETNEKERCDSKLETTNHRQPSCSRSAFSSEQNETLEVSKQQSPSSKGFNFKRSLPLSYSSDSETNENKVQSASKKKVVPYTSKRRQPSSSFKKNKSRLISSSSEDIEDIDNHAADANKVPIRRKVNNKALAAYIETIDAKECGISKEKFVQELHSLHKILNDFKVIKQLSNQESSSVELSMEETFKWRFYEYFNLKRISIQHTVDFYPGLKIFSWLPKEYWLMYPKRCKSPNFLDDVESVLLKFAVDRNKSKQNFRSNECRRLIPNLKTCVIGKCMTEEQLTIAAYTFAMEVTSEKVSGTLFKLRDKAKKLKIDRLTPFIDIEKITDKDVWDKDYPMTIYIERQEVLRTKNFYEALIASYIYYWIFYLKYVDQDAVLYKQFDEVGGNSASASTSSKKKTRQE